MKTTIELPDDLFKKAKIKALENGMTLKEFFIDAISQKLNSTQNRNTDTMPWKALIGTATIVPHLELLSGFDEESNESSFNEFQLNEDGAHDFIGYACLDLVANSNGTINVKATD